MSRSVQPKSPLQRGQQKREFAATTTTQAKRRKLTEQEAPNEMEIDPTLSTLHPPTHPHTQPATLHFNNAPLRRRAHSPVAKKKMVIKPFKVKPKLAESFESDTQAQLTLAVEAVYRKATIQMSQEELYRAVEAMCIHNKAPMIYANLFSQCDRHVAELLTSLDDQLRQQQQQQQQQQPHDTYQIATFLQQIQSVWSGHCDEMMTIRGIFLYLDRTYVIQLAAAHQTQPNHNNTMEDTNHHTEPPPKSIWDMGIGLFCTQLKKHPAVEEHVLSGLLSLISRDRHGELVDRSLLKSLLRMLVSLKLYSESFQTRFLQTTQEFYKDESTRMIATSTPVEYIHYIQQRLDQEDDRANAYLDESTRGPLTHLMQSNLITAHSDQMLGAGFKLLIDTKRSPELAAMYKLFSRVGKLDGMKDAFGSYVKVTATEIVTSGSAEPTEATAPPNTHAAAAAAGPSSTSAPPAASPAPAGSSSQSTMILDLLKLKATLDQLMTLSFASNTDFAYSMKVAFEHALNSVDNKPAELIAKFLDKILKTGGKGIKIGGGMQEIKIEPDASGAATTSATAGTTINAPSSSLSSGVDDVESLLSDVMFLFRYIHGKDVFQAFFKKDLAKRLLLHKSASIDAEKSMIAKIKAECGATFTTKLEGMFKDMDLSRETQSEYEKHRQQQLQGMTPADAALAPELSVQVLTTGSWPAYTPVECTLPADVARMHDDFKLFYLHKHTGRKLIWHHSLATAILRAHFNKARKELAVSGMQAVVLMLFNEHEKLTMEEIGKYSGITDVMELKRTLASLTFADDVKILLKEPRNKKLLSTDVFRVDQNFNYKLFRIKINSVQLKETKEEQKTTTTRVFEDRQYALDAAIVRIMKARKTISHQLLVMEVMQQIKFPTKPADIKKRIASLIEREYMERDKDDSAVYVYMA